MAYSHDETGGAVRGPDGPTSPTVLWRLHLRSPPERVFDMLATDAGRSRFWAERTAETGEGIRFEFPNGESWHGVILDFVPHTCFAFEYFGSRAVFELTPDGAGGTDLMLLHHDIPAEDHADVLAGWVSVLLNLKAAVDFGIDLRNHDPTRTWTQGYADN